MAKIFGGGAQIPSYRWMVFIDGENFTIQGQNLAQHKGITLNEGKYYCKDIFLWIPEYDAHGVFSSGHLRLAPRPIRTIYYTSVVGDESKIEDTRRRLWELHFNSTVFKKSRKGEKAKGVDITLTKDMLMNAFLDNFDVAILLAGDGDYVPVVDEVKRLGKVIDLVFFEGNGLNKNLKLNCDSFRDISDLFISSWQNYQTS